MAERKPSELKRLEEIISGSRDSVIQILYEIYCRLTNIEYFTYRSSLSNIGNINFIDILDVGTEPTEIVQEVASDRAVRIYNLSYDNPDIVMVNTVGTEYGIPINAGESISIFVREGKRLFATFQNTPNKVAVAYLTT